MTTTLSLNGIRATSVRLVTPWSGAWSADVDLDLGDLPDLPTGPCTLAIAELTLVGTIDPAQSGRMGFLARARVVAGAGGWEKSIPPVHHHNDAGVVSTTVFSAAAALVGERVVEDEGPTRFGVDFVRFGLGAAARVLDGVEWRVDENGLTHVGPRPTAPTPDGVRVLEWDARTRTATIAADEVLVAPGMVLHDDRFGSATVREVEQTWSDAGARAIARTMPVGATPAGRPGGELVAILGAIAGDACKDLPTFRYSVLSQAADGRFTLQSLAPSSAAPDLKAISLTPAVPGMSVQVPPGTIVHVVFVRGPQGSIPVVVRFEAGPKPIKVKIDAANVHAGSGAAPLLLSPVALATPLEQAFQAIVTAVGATGGTGSVAAAATLQTALAAINVASTVLTSE